MLARALCLLLAQPVLALTLGASAAFRPVAAAVRSPAPALALSNGQQKKGSCKWFDTTKGFGFIAVDGEDVDIFVHQSDIYAPGFRSLAEGELVEFQVTVDPKSGKLKAIEVTGPEGAYVRGAPQPDNMY